MSLKPPSVSEEDSFIILGTSPGTSLDKWIEKDGPSLDRTQLDDALQDVGKEASMAFKAHFKMGDSPSPSSVMVASTIITDDKTTEELQKSFGEIIDENLVLKEMLKQNNESMKEQFLLIASCQEDMLKTHKVHKEKFDETRDLVEKLRQENKKLRSDIFRLTDESSQRSPIQSSPVQSLVAPHSLAMTVSQSSALAMTVSQSSAMTVSQSSAMEFVTSPDDDTINKLTHQLELVEKQRRQVIIDNEKLTWQKESLEHIVDATTKERDELKEKIMSLEIQLSNKDEEYKQRIELLNLAIHELNAKLQEASNKPTSSEEITTRDAIIHQLETKVGALHKDLQNAQLKILDLETVKLEFTKYKSDISDTSRIHREQIQELHDRLKEAQTTMFQPARLSISTDETGSEFGGLMNKVKHYDTTLKNLAELLNSITHGASDNLVQAMGACESLHDYKLERATVAQVKAGLNDLKGQLKQQHSNVLANVAQIREALTLFEDIFKDCNELLKKSVMKQQEVPKMKQQEVSKPTITPSSNVETLTNALLARGQELLALKGEVAALKASKEDVQLLKAQLDLYKSDFEAERAARGKMASDKDTILTDLRLTQKHNKELLMQLEEVRKLNPNIHKSATSKRLASNQTPRATRPVSSNITASGNPAGNMVYTCPKCMRFSSNQYRMMEEHFEDCLDDF